MARLHEQLKYFVNQKVATDPSWQSVDVVLSGQEVGVKSPPSLSLTFSFFPAPPPPPPPPPLRDYCSIIVMGNENRMQGFLLHYLHNAVKPHLVVTQ